MSEKWFIALLCASAVLKASAGIVNSDQNRTIIPRVRCPGFENGSFPTRYRYVHEEDAVLPVLIFVDDHRLSIQKRDAIRYVADTVICHLFHLQFGFTVKFVQIYRNIGSRHWGVVSVHVDREDVFRVLSEFRSFFAITPENALLWKRENDVVSCKEQMQTALSLLSSREQQVKWLELSVTPKLFLLFDESGSECVFDKDLERKGWSPIVTQIGESTACSSDKCEQFADWEQLIDVYVAKRYISEFLIRQIYTDRDEIESKLRRAEAEGKVRRVTYEQFHRSNEPASLERLRWMATASITNGLCVMLSVMFTLFSTCFVCGTGCVQAERLAADHAERFNRLGVEVNGRFVRLVQGAPLPEELQVDLR